MKQNFIKLIQNFKNLRIDGEMDSKDKKLFWQTKIQLFSLAIY